MRRAMMIASALATLACLTACGGDDGPAAKRIEDAGRHEQEGPAVSEVMDETGRRVAREHTGISASGYDLTTPSDEQLAERAATLDPEARQVTMCASTERPGTSAFLNEMRTGLFLCALCDLPLYRSGTKFKSGTGWPSFYEPVDEDVVAELVDRSHGMVRTELRCARCGSHLGHVFADAPSTPTGMRHCINGASLRFVPEGEELPAGARKVR